MLKQIPASPSEYPYALEDFQEGVYTDDEGRKQRWARYVIECTAQGSNEIAFFPYYHSYDIAAVLTAREVDEPVPGDEDGATEHLWRVGYKMVTRSGTRHGNTIDEAVGVATTLVDWLRTLKNPATKKHYELGDKLDCGLDTRIAPAKDRRF